MRNMSLLETTKSLLRTNRIRPNILLGQNFMVDPSIFQIMNDSALLDRDDVVIDIGAGLGFLTRFLAERSMQVLAVEMDSQLSRVLAEQLKGLSNVTVIMGDVLRTEIPEFNKAVSIPPYHISSRLLRWLLQRHFDSSVLVFQEEFARRLTASVGSEDYGWLTVLTYYRAECELLDRVPRRMFYPEPNVDSTIVHLRPKESAPFMVEDEARFIRLVQDLFTERNRKVRNAVRPLMKRVLAGTDEGTQMISRRIPFCNERVRQLAPEDFGALANAIFS
jgi:16S rRNA (adenine1518-N6/adenine1519-N6)-dimethyltransferase